MKQNERILVYFVTGFLAVILVVAVFFGREGNAAGKPDTGETVRGLGQILEQKPVTGSGEVGSDDVGATDRTDPTDPKVRPKGDPPAEPPPVGERQEGAMSDVMQPPLVATLPVPAAQRVVELFGESRRDRNVRIVTASSGDSLESLVRRWCGKRDPFLEEAKSLNEDLTILRPDQKVVVPWVDDEAIVAAHEARQPRLLAGGSTRPEPAIQSGQPSNGEPSFQVPGSDPKPQPVSSGAPAGTELYVVKPNDSLWRIAASRYGARNADKMIKEIKRLNGLSGDALQIKQKLIVPAKSS